MSYKIISVWNDCATFFNVLESEETIEYKIIVIPEEINEKVKKTINSVVDLTKDEIYPLTPEIKEKLEKIGLKF
ncbi:MAG: hypothetical protein ACFFDW_08900 [Candidatus Thorarchaeota archaeon]